MNLSAEKITSKCENNETDYCYVVMQNTTKDRVNNDIRYMEGYDNSYTTYELGEANEFETFEQAKAVAENHDFILNGIGNLWGAEIYVIRIERDYYEDKDFNNRVIFNEIESTLIWSA
jgi:hypothetical protein